VLLFEADPANFSEHENIPFDRLTPLQLNCARGAVRRWCVRSAQDGAGASCAKKKAAISGAGVQIIACECSFWTHTSSTLINRLAIS
jgi:hypothetical protein